MVMTCTALLLQDPDVFYKARCYKKQFCEQREGELAKEKRGEAVKIMFYCVGESNELRSDP